MLDGECADRNQSDLPRGSKSQYDEDALFLYEGTMQMVWAKYSLFQYFNLSGCSNFQLLRFVPSGLRGHSSQKPCFWNHHRVEIY